MQNDNISGQASLDLIQSMINRAKNQFGENGHLYLVWGWTVLLCSVGQFVLQYFFSYKNPQIVWTLTFVALIYQTFYLIKAKKNEKVRTYTGDILGHVWLVFTVLMILIGFIVGKGNNMQAQTAFTPVILCLYGMPIYLSGQIIQFRPLWLGGIGCWILAIISLTVPVDFLVLMIGAAIIIAWIIPGYLLRNKFKKEAA